MVNSLGDLTHKIVKKAIWWVNNQSYVNGYQLTGIYGAVASTEMPNTDEVWGMHDVGLAAASFSDLIAKGLDTMVLGPSSSVQAIGMAPTLRIVKIPMISFGAGGSDLTGKPYFYRTCASDTDQMDLMLETMTAISLTTGGARLFPAIRPGDPPAYCRCRSTHTQHVQARQDILPAASQFEACHCELDQSVRPCHERYKFATSQSPLNWCIMNPY
jgi:hypothetical protein